MAKIGAKRRAQLIARGLLVERLRKIKFIKEQCLSDPALARRVDSMMSRRAVFTCSRVAYARLSEASESETELPVICSLLLQFYVLLHVM